MKIEIEAEAVSDIFKLIGSLIQSKTSIPTKWYSIEDCALAWGLKRGYFYRFRHLLPNFGVFDDPVHKRFSEKSFIEWVSVPLFEWERRWAELTPEQRREIDCKHAEQNRKRISFAE